jgi:transitional endoplasmic reticulum ATPase
MRRRTSLSHTWSLSTKDPLGIPNARIALALLRCVRRLPGAFALMDFDDLGAAFAPVIEKVDAAFRTVLKAHLAVPRKSDLELDDLDLRSDTLLHDRRVHALLGESLARANPAFIALFDKAEATLLTFVERHPHPSDQNIAMLANMLDLPPPEVAFLKLAAAFCYGTIDRSNFTFVNSGSRLVKVLETLCEAKGTAALRIFDIDRPLARSALFENPRGARPTADLEDLLRLSMVGERLLSSPFSGPAEMSAAVLKPLSQRPHSARLEWPHLARSQALLCSAMSEALRSGHTGFNVLLHGAPGTGKTEFARALVSSVDASGFCIDHTDEHGGEASRGERLASLRLSQTFASQHHRAVLVLDEAEDIFQADYQNPFARVFKRPNESKAWMNNLLESNPHPVVWISNQVGHLDPAYLRRFAFCLEFPKTPYALRRRIVDEQLSVSGCNAQTIDAIAASEHMTPALLASAVTFATLSARSGLGPDLAVRTLVDEHAKAAGRIGPPPMPRLATRFDTRYLNVVGNTTPQRLLDALRAEQPTALVFCGAPGTGKTQFAAEIAKRLGRQLVVRTASDINSKWYGESEGNVAQMFHSCDHASEVLFLDEAEVLLGSRTDTHHRADRAVTAEFLRWLEVFEGTFICATNHVADFDAALMRRFTFRLEFKPMTRAQREEMYAEVALGWRLSESSPLPCLHSEASVRLAELVLLTPGDFANAARRVRQLGLGTDAWLDELEAEHGAKGGARSARIGFV